jgi:hypothetical protein
MGEDNTLGTVMAVKRRRVVSQPVVSQPVVKRRKINGHQPTGDELKILGMQRAIAAKRAWFDHAMHTIIHIFIPASLVNPPSTGMGPDDFDCEDLDDAIGLPSGKEGRDLNGAVGGAFGTASRRGLAYEVGRKKSRRPRSHSNKHSVWRGTGVMLGPNDKNVKPCPHCGGWIPRQKH